MNLNIYNSILRGALRPSMLTPDIEKDYKEKIRTIAGFIVPPNGISTFHEYLIEVAGHNELFVEDDLEIFFNQKPSLTSIVIEQPIISYSLEKPLSTTKRFYYILLNNETTRISNRIFQAMNMSIKPINRKGIIDTVLRSIKSVFTDLVDAKRIAQNDIATFVYAQLEGNLIRLLLEVEALFPALITHATDEYQLYGELLHYDTIPNPLPYSVTEYGNSILSTINGIEIIDDNQTKQPTETKQPKAKGVLWLRYLNYDTNVEALKDLLSSLKVLGCIESTVGIIEFKKVFSGESLENPIIWIGSKGDLKTLILELIKQRKVEEPSYKWKTMSKIFIQSDGSPFDNSIKNIPATIKEGKIIAAVEAM